jgi:hypothetical protein
VLTHVVMFRLTDPGDATETVARLAALRGQVPGLLGLWAGTDTLRTEQSYDVALVTTHEGRDGLAAYAAHPLHQDFLDWLRPRLAARVAVDHEGDAPALAG